MIYPQQRPRGKDWRVLFTNDRGEMIKSWEFSREVWNPTLQAVGLVGRKPNGQHNLRHYCGHQSIKTTFGTYGHLYPVRTAEVN